MTNRSLVLLSGEGTSIPVAEAKALFSAYDPKAKFAFPEPRVVVAESDADPFVVGTRAAYSRRVGFLFSDLHAAVEHVGGRSVRLRAFDVAPGLVPLDPARFLRGTNVRVSLASPQLELTVVRGSKEYIAVTDPMSMRQDWSKRRPRARAFFHPSAIFPKLSRAIVNLTRCREGGLFLDPFSGTGSLPIEAHLVGAKVVAADFSARMAAGSLANMHRFAQGWLGVVRTDSLSPPFTGFDAVATDVPYGRASSTGGRHQADLVSRAVETIPSVMRGGARLVLMHRKQEALGSTSDFDLEEEHDLYVHKLLTRTISVLRRK